VFRTGRASFFITHAHRAFAFKQDCSCLCVGANLNARPFSCAAQKGACRGETKAFMDAALEIAGTVLALTNAEDTG